MHPSLENRLRISLLLFVVCDHAVWYYGGFFAQVSLPYTIASECLRLVACAALIDSFYKKRVYTKVLFSIFVYCFIMILFSYLAGDLRGRYLSEIPNDNIVWIKKDANIPVKHAGLALVFYMFFPALMYHFAWKYIDPLPKTPHSR